MWSAPASRLTSGLLLALIVGLAAVGVTRSTGTAPARLASVAQESGPPRIIGAVPDDGSRLVRRPPPRGPADPIPTGTPEAPFVPLPSTGEIRLVVSPTGLALPVIDRRGDGWLVSTPCQATEVVDGAMPVERVHVVLDPGHGGAEPGAVGPSGLAEKDLNLFVARETARRLTEAGAAVLLTRDGDHTMTAAARGLVARAVGPALLVSIHHNGGAEPGPGGPGTIVFTKADSPESTRFGGLFHRALQPLLTEAAASARERHRAWIELTDLAGEGVEPEGEPVPEFRWAGSGNAGVRSWRRPDGLDQLAVLRHSGSTPAVLAEFLYVTNPSEEALLAQDDFLVGQAAALSDAIVEHFAGASGGTGFVADQIGDQPIGGSGGRDSCIEPPLR